MQPFAEWFIQLVEIISDLAVALAAIVAAAVGGFGYAAWRRELVGKARYEAVRAVMRKVFEFQQAFSDARKEPIVQNFESRRVRLADETPEISRIKDFEFDTRPRIEALRRASVELQESCWEAEFLLGEAPGDLYSEFGKLSEEITHAWSTYYTYSYFLLLEKQEPTDAEIDIVDHVKQRAIDAKNLIYGPDGDEISMRAHSAMVILRRKVNKHLQA